MQLFCKILLLFTLIRHSHCDNFTFTSTYNINLSKNDDGNNYSQTTKSAAPSGIIISPNNEYALISDQNNHVIRLLMLSTSSVVIVAGSGSIGKSNGVATNAEFNSPFGLSISPDGNFALIADRDNSLIRHMTLSTRLVTTFAGSGLKGSFNGVGTNARFNHPFSVAISPNETIALIADSYTNRIRLLIISTASVFSFAGSGSVGTADGIGTNARFNLPMAISFSPSGCYALVADYHNHMIRHITISTISVTTLIGSGSGSGTGGVSLVNINGVGTYTTTSEFQNVISLCVSPDGMYILVPDYNDHSIRRVEISTATITTIQNLQLTKGGEENGQSEGKIPPLKWPTGVSISPNGKFSLIIAASSQIVRRIDIEKRLTRFSEMSQLSLRQFQLACPRYTAERTNNATTNATACGFMICPRDVATLYLCGLKNSFVSIHNSRGKFVASVHNGCDDCSSVTFRHNRSTVEYLWDCDLFTLRQGCLEAASCSGESRVEIELADEYIIKYSFGVVNGNQSIMTRDQGIVVTYFPSPAGKENAKPISHRTSSDQVLTDEDIFPSHESMLIKWRPVYVNRVTHQLTLGWWEGSATIPGGKLVSWIMHSSTMCVTGFIIHDTAVSNYRVYFFEDVPRSKKKSSAASSSPFPPSSGIRINMKKTLTLATLNTYHRDISSRHYYLLNSATSATFDRMLKAEQNALLQEANQQLLSIRREELEYFVGVFSDFGTQAALIAGFTLSNLTQVDAIDSDVSAIWKWLFWISCSIVLVTSLHVVLTTTFINIFGPGLALRGPAGSMVRAVEGMNKEKDAIFVAFFISILLFQVGTVAASFLVMSTSAAWTSMVLCIGGLYIWYIYCLRIYNRFKLDEISFAWNDDQEDGPPVNDSLKRKLTTDSSGPFSTQNEKEIIIAAAAANENKSKNKFPKFLSTQKSDTASTVAPSSSEPSTIISNNLNHNYMEGYLTLKSHNSNLFSDPWMRYYFVLHQMDLYYYKNKEDYDISPKKTIRNRPINISQFILSSNQGIKGELEITLLPIVGHDERKSWEFRVDTVPEYESWVGAFLKGGAQRPIIDTSVVG